MSGSSKDTVYQKVPLDLNGLTKKQVPDLILNSENCLQPCPINPEYISELVDDSSSRVEMDEQKLRKVQKFLKKQHPNEVIKKLREKKIYKIALRRVKKSRALRRNFTTCLSTILNREPKRVNGIWEYRAAHKLQNSGRLSEKHGGFQTLHKVGKLLLLQDVPNIYNFDIVSCQSVILEQELSNLNISCKWLTKYNKNKALREQYADEIGISEGCWKDAYFAIIMGAEDTHFGSAFNSIYEEIGDFEEAINMTDKFLAKIGPLLKASKKWREHLYTTTDKGYVKKYGVYKWRNSCGMLYRDYMKSPDNNPLSSDGKIITNKTEIKRIKRKIAAFYLQGGEQKVIHMLTIACTKFNIPVYKNEYDGLITGALIPRPLFKMIAKQAGYPALEIARKDICTKKKMKELMNYFGREDPYFYSVI
jgi:hypothetical protein